MKPSALESRSIIAGSSDRPPEARAAAATRGRGITCSRCIYNDSIPGIEFDEAGVCTYCRMTDDLAVQYGTGSEKGRGLLHDIVEQIKAAGKGKPYDCVVGVSGGTDSSYLLHWAVEHGLRPLACHYDNTWNSAIATENISKVTKALGVDLYTHVLDNEESNDIVRAFFLSGINTIDIATDLALAETLYRAASAYGISYLLEGHSFVAEGVSPISNSYVDGRLVQDVGRRYGRMKWRSYPLMTFSRFMKWTLVKRIRKIRPLWYVQYNKAEARALLEQRYGWRYYGGHHLENRITAFAHSVYKPQKFGIDERYNSLSAQVRSGVMSRDDALVEYRTPPIVQDGIVDYFVKRIGIGRDEYERIMLGPRSTFHDFRTYKARFEALRPMFFTLAKANLVPMSFYLKYCFPIENPDDRYR